MKPHDYSKMPNTTMYPLLNSAEIRYFGAGELVKKPYKIEYYGFHLHNFFMSQQEIRNKYSTYTHADKNAHTVDFGYLNRDSMMAYNCALDRPDNKKVRIKGHRPWRRVIGGLAAFQGPKPVLFQQLPAYVRARHIEVKGFFS